MVDPVNTAVHRRAVVAGAVRGVIWQSATSIDRVLYRLSWVGHVLSAVIVVLLTLLVTLSSMARTVFGIALLDHVTPGRLAMTLFLFSGIAWVLRQERHVAVRIVSDRLPLRWRFSIHASVMCLALVAVCVLIWETWEFAFAALAMNEQIIGDILLPAFPFQAAVPAGLVLLALEMLRTIARDVAAAITDAPPAVRDGGDEWD